MKKQVSIQPPSADVARAYVYEGIHNKGGWGEAFSGFFHKSLPDAVGAWKGVTFGSVIALIARFLMFAVAVLFPILLRKIATPPQSQPAETSQTVSNGMGTIASAIGGATALDYLLAGIALLIFGTPKVVDALSAKKDAGEHSPFKELTAAIQKLPIKEPLKASETDDAIRLTLSALRQEMSLLIGSSSHQNVTDVTLLEFCDKEGKNIQVRARTANHEQVKRPVESHKFVAHYVAMIGRNFAEHDFKNKRNPFPAKRLTVGRGLDVDYRSVLYMPLICSEAVRPEKGAEGPPQLVDSCVGIICVHSSKPYRFWRWGDHKKGTGGFADVAFGRSMPYIAVLEQLLSRTGNRVKLEVQ